jgi:hypothetical protein
LLPHRIGVFSTLLLAVFPPITRLFLATTAAAAVRPFDHHRSMRASSDEVLLNDHESLQDEYRILAEVDCMIQPRLAFRQGKRIQSSLIPIRRPALRELLLDCLALMRIPTKKIAHSELMTIRRSPKDAGESIVDQPIVISQ